MSKRDELMKGVRLTLSTLDLPPLELEKAKAITDNPVEKSVTDNKVIKLNDLILNEGGKVVDMPESGNSALQKSNPDMSQVILQSKNSRQSKSNVLQTRSKGYKFENYTRIDVRLTSEQVRTLDELERVIQRNRIDKRERITKASILRIMAEAIPHLNIDFQNIPDEIELKQRIFTRLGLKP